MSSLFSLKNGLKFFSFFFIYLAVVLFIGACSCGKAAGNNNNQPGGSGENNQPGQSPGDGQPKETPGQQVEKPGWGAVTTNAPWSDRLSFQALVFDDKLWVLGGDDGTGAGASDKIWFSPDGTNWTEVTPVGNSWNPRYAFQAEVFKNKIWILGGQSKDADGTNVYLKDIWSSPDGTNWTEVAPTGAWTLGARDSYYQLQTVVYLDEMWVLGKYYDNEILRSSDGTNWTRVATGLNHWPTRISHQAAVFKGKMWVVGGDDGRRNYDDVWSSFDGRTWTKYTTSSITPGSNWKLRHSFRMVPFDGKLWVLGGKLDKPTPTTRTRVFYDDVWTTTDGNRWQEFSTGGPWDARVLFEVVAFKGSLWILGGGISSSGSTSYKSDVWRLAGYEQVCTIYCF